jgi:hypothetical protein
MKGKKVVKVAPEHIQAGIDRYGGVIDLHLPNIIVAAGLHYTPYTFKDGRILLVLPDNLAAFLYIDEQTVYLTLSLEA